MNRVWLDLARAVAGAERRLNAGIDKKDARDAKAAGGGLDTAAGQGGSRATGNRPGAV